MLPIPSLFKLWPLDQKWLSLGHMFSSPEPKADEMSLYDGTRAGVRPSVRPLTPSMNISETSGPIEIKFHLEHYWGGGKTALGFGSDRIRALVSMTT